MIKTMRNSRIEVWGHKYINHPASRNENDVDVIVVQAEPLNEAADCIVEVVSPGDCDKELSAGKKTGIVHCKDCNAYTETGPGTGVCPAFGGVTDNNGCTMGDRKESEK